MKSALWNTLYTTGHDAARLSEIETGWRLDGMAVYDLNGKPVQVRYGLDLNHDWSTQSGMVEGFIGTQPVKRDIRRNGASWTIDGVSQEAVYGALDLDFGFTPATNHPQLQRMALEVGETKEIVVAWLDLESTALQPLPQIYSRTSDEAYDYNSPQGPYRATLKIAPNGFVSDYPTLWAML